MTASLPTGSWWLGALAQFVFIYPVAMGVVWMVGGLCFWWWRERRRTPSSPDTWLTVSILVPCHNEAKAIAATCENLAGLDYPSYQVIFIDDASADDTQAILRDHIDATPTFHLLHLPRNQGKARALNAALALVKTPLVLVLDADTRLRDDALRLLAAPFTRQPRLGAVTANPIPLNRKGFWGRFQAAEFSSIIGLIKRCQRVWGRLFTVSGCATIFSARVLREAGGFSPSTATEDIDITWRIQRAGYEVWFEPAAVAYIQVPACFSEYWRQRRRWALGGWHLLRGHRGVFSSRRWRRLWPVYLDSALGYLWAFAFVGLSLAWLLALTIGWRAPVVVSPIPAWPGAVVSVVCVTQMAVAARINGTHDPDLRRCLFWIPWYPLLFFAVSAIVAVGTAPEGLLGRLDRVGLWQSPTRDG